MREKFTRYNLTLPTIHQGPAGLGLVILMMMMMMMMMVMSCVVMKGELAMVCASIHYCNQMHLQSYIS